MYARRVSFLSDVRAASRLGGDDEDTDDSGEADEETLERERPSEMGIERPGDEKEGSRDDIRREAAVTHRLLLLSQGSGGFQLDQHRAARDTIARRGMNMADARGTWRGDRVFHLHCLQHNEWLPYQH